MRRLFVLLVGLSVALSAMAQTGRIPKNFVPLSLSYSWPGGGLSDRLQADPALGFSLGYQYSTDRHVRLTVRASWMRMTLGITDSSGDASYGLSHVGVLAGAMYRFNKHGWTPYIQGEGGLGIMFADEEIDNIPRKIDGLSEVKFSLAGTAGVLIPVSETIDLDLSGRYHYTYVDDGFSAVAAHVGVVYALR